MVNIILTNRTQSVLEGLTPSPLAPLLPIANDTIRIDSLKLTAGFPFNTFVMPDVKFQSVKDKILQGEWEKGCDARTSSSSIKDSFFDVTFNVTNRENQLIEAECLLKDSKENKTYTPNKTVGTSIITTDAVSLHSIFVTNFGYNISNILNIIPFDAIINIKLPKDIAEQVGTKTLDVDYKPLLRDLQLKHLYYSLSFDSKFDIIPINFEAVKEIIKTLQWFLIDIAPSISEVDGDQVKTYNSTRLIDPITFHSGDPIILSTDSIFEWKEATSKIGFEVGEFVDEENGIFIEPFKINPKGQGRNHVFRNLDSLFIFRDDSKFLLSPFLHLAAKATAIYYDSIFADKLLEISTVETTPIAPYSKVQIESKTYYCIEANIPYPDFGVYRYKLQEIK